MGQIQLTTSLILIGLFTVAIIGFTVNFALDNNSPVDISNDPELSSLNSQTKGNLSQFGRSEEHTSELQSHSFISYAVFCLKKKTFLLFFLLSSLPFFFF